MNEHHQASDFERQVVELLTLATEYFRFLENLENASNADIKQFIRKISALLYTKGLLFPETEQPDETGNERFVTEEQWESVFNAVRSKLGNDDEFYYLESPDSADEISKGSLGELTADVYQDMKDFAVLLTKPTQLAYDNAIYEIKKLFENHWGPRLLTILQVLHARETGLTDETEPDW